MARHPQTAVDAGRHTRTYNLLNYAYPRTSRNNRFISWAGFLRRNGLCDVRAHPIELFRPITKSRYTRPTTATEGKFAYAEDRVRMRISVKSHSHLPSLQTTPTLRVGQLSVGRNVALSNAAEGRSATCCTVDWALRVAGEVERRHLRIGRGVATPHVSALERVLPTRTAEVADAAQ